MSEAGWMLVAVLRLLLASACGAVIGWEREVREKGAGLRTHILIAFGACLFCLIALRVREATGGELLRVLQGMLLAVGFLAGGVIFTGRGTVHGLTTAAGLWVVTGLGLAAGLGYYFLALFGTLMTWATVAWLKRLEPGMRRPRDEGPEDGGPAQ